MNPFHFPNTTDLPTLKFATSLKNNNGLMSAYLTEACIAEIFGDAPFKETERTIERSANAWTSEPIIDPVNHIIFIGMVKVTQYSFLTQDHYLITIEPVRDSYRIKGRDSSGARAIK